MDNLICILDDEVDILDILIMNLQKSGFKAVGFSDPSLFFSYIKKSPPRLIILDLMLPNIDGYDICKNLRNNPEFSTIPIIILSAKSDEADKILGLELGADDYMTKPFSPKELVTRVKAVLRRVHVSNNQNAKSNKIVLSSSLSINPDTFEVIKNGKTVDLTTTEFKILYFLSTKIGWVFSREQILDYLWGNEKSVIDRTIDVHIKHLREKLGSDGNIIKNIRGIGYKIDGCLLSLSNEKV